MTKIITIDHHYNAPQLINPASLNLLIFVCDGRAIVFHTSEAIALVEGRS
ncbi:MAG: hypothetical protein F6K17_16650 [Okeania sp. SIO3C4]|nr:hypothetical protein [Okeania sp. SIO3B3]NER04123.1 hypothetical protein [Okeania sp. SIO3C4]